MSPIDALLAAHPLPPVDGDKRERGSAVVVAGSEECPGGALLAAVAALRVGAGKVQVITHPTVAVAVGVAIPESLVVGWDPDEPAPERVKQVVSRADAVLVGPGLLPGATTVARGVAEHVEPGTPLVLDALSLDAAGDLGEHRLVLLPNASEAADLAGPSGPDGIGALAHHLATTLGAVVAVRGETSVVTAGDDAWESGGHDGLGTSGSGDVLAGAVVGLLARGVAPIVALGWAIAAHAEAGALTARSIGGPAYGYLAREVGDALPAAITSVQARVSGR